MDFISGEFTDRTETPTLVGKYIAEWIYCPHHYLSVSPHSIPPSLSSMRDSDGLQSWSAPRRPVSMLLSAALEGKTGHPLNSSSWLILTVGLNRFILLWRATGFSEIYTHALSLSFSLLMKCSTKWKALQNNTFQDSPSLRKHNVTLWTLVFHTERKKLKMEIYMHVFFPTTHS